MDLIRHIQSFGFDVYARGRNAKYCYFTDGTNVAYVQWDRIAGFTVSTSHKPCKENGTGFQIARHVYEIDRPTLEQALRGVRPRWATNKGQRWRSVDEWLNSSEWNKGFRFYRDTPPKGESFENDPNEKTVYENWKEARS